MPPPHPGGPSVLGMPCSATTGQPLSSLGQHSPHAPSRRQPPVPAILERINAGIKQPLSATKLGMLLSKLGFTKSPLTTKEGIWLLNVPWTRFKPVGKSRPRKYNDNRLYTCKRPKHGIHPSRRMPIGMHPTFRLLSFKLFSLRF